MWIQPPTSSEGAFRVQVAGLNARSGTRSALCRAML
eukprot:COSAG06_NODE_37497_length_434_cov_1.355224_2_plen_35_part_01